MIKEQLEKNENVKPNTKLLNQLKKNFPDFFDKDNNFKLEKFKNVLKSDEINITKEGYELNFLGKSYARFQSSTETETIISPLTDHNNEDENKNSENLYIIGDNVDALKHLLKSYSRKVKCIYIDPPYNTGSDGFVYPDNFKFDSGTLSNKMGIDAEEAERIIDMRGKSTHSAWLTFMYSRLVLARELLSDDGVIFISIDDNEQSNLKLICDEIFGEENFVGCISRTTGTTTGQDGNKIGSSLDYCLSYSKTNQYILKGVELDDIDLKRFNREDSRGKYSQLQLRKTGNEDRKEDREKMFYPIVAPDGTKVYPFGPTDYLSRWRIGKKSYDELIEQDLIVWEKKEISNPKIIEGYKESPWKPYLKYYLEGRTKQVSNLLENYGGGLLVDFNGDKIDGNKKASLELKNLFEVGNIFSNPKPTQFIEILMKISDTPNFIILDFFSGSATTAHAVMKLNAEDGGNRKYILVQLPEEIEESKPAFKAGYKTIDEIGRERIRLAAQKIKEETNADIDYGFKVVKLETVQENTLDRLESFDPNVLVSDDYVNDFSNEDSSGLETILTTWLNQDGYGLHAKWEDFKLVNYIAHRYSNSLYIVNEGIESSDISRLIEMIENNELNISRIVIYTYSLPFTIINELKTNIKNLRNNKTVDIIERY